MVKGLLIHPLESFFLTMDLLIIVSRDTSRGNILMNRLLDMFNSRLESWFQRVEVVTVEDVNRVCEEVTRVVDAEKIMIQGEKQYILERGLPVIMIEISVTPFYAEQRLRY